MNVKAMTFLLGKTLLLIGLLIARDAGSGTAFASNPLVLWYNSPAEKWTEAVPIGNGRLGAMVFGKTDCERIQINEDTVWAGSPHDYSHPGAAKYLPEIRRLLFEGKQEEATALAMEHFMSVPLRQMPYQPCCDLYLDFGENAKVSSYRRELDLSSATAITSYQVDGVT
ncbi:MAG TPA: glycoside hydrolase family 95 protein, partial [Thermogutta sp.]|nr:glycoside hydrolase family 95 protein [Thermogutta sp.]